MFRYTNTLAIKSWSRRNYQKQTVLGPELFAEDPKIFAAVCKRNLPLPSGKVWLIRIQWPLFAKAGKKAECSVYEGWVKTN